MVQLVMAPDFQKHGAGKQAVPCFLRDDADRETVIEVCARETVLHENIAPLQVALQTGEHSAEARAGEWPVVLAPPDLVFGGMFAHNELIGSGTGGVLAGVDHERSEV
jgi:hypothetical protein